MSARSEYLSESGRSIGESLGKNAAKVMLREYANRSCEGEVSEAGQRWRDAWELLEEILGDRRNDEIVVGVLRELDEALGDYLVEHEDRAWYAAWTAARTLAR